MSRHIAAITLLACSCASERDAWLYAGVAGGVVAAGAAAQTASTDRADRRMLPATIAVAGAVVGITAAGELYVLQPPCAAEESTP